MPQLYPIMLDLSGRRILIVGGGAVAVRKAQGLLSAGARFLRCVAPAIDAAMPPEVERVLEEFAPAHLAGAGLVFAATDRPDVNESVVRECHLLGVWVNRADIEEERPGNFTVPAVHRAGRVVVAVSADGSPALAARLRDELAGKIGDAWQKLAEAIAVLRPRIRKLGLPAAERRSILLRLASNEARQWIEQGADAEELWRWVQNEIDRERR